MKLLALLSSILCAGFAAGHTLNRELAARKPGGALIVLGRDLMPLSPEPQPDHPRRPGARGAARPEAYMLEQA